MKEASTEAAGDAKAERMCGIQDISVWNKSNNMKERQREMLNRRGIWNNKK